MARVDAGKARNSYADFRFYQELNDFLPVELRGKTFRREFFGHPALKSTIEAIGVPHTEIDLILVDGVSVAFTHRLDGGERVAVYPMFESMDVSGLSLLRRCPLRKPRFILDAHLGKLARLLRLLGFDALYRNDYDDPEIVQVAIDEQRTILTRDLGILKNSRVTHGYWLRSQKPNEQVRELISHFDLSGWARPLTRCLLCNGLLVTKEKESVEGLLPLETKRHYERFGQCADCGRVYWRGAHFADLRKIVENVL